MNTKNYEVWLLGRDADDHAVDFEVLVAELRDSLEDAAVSSFSKYLDSAELHKFLETKNINIPDTVETVVIALEEVEITAYGDVECIDVVREVNISAMSLK